VRLHEKGGKRREMPTHYNLDAYLEEYVQRARIAQDRKGPLFRTAHGKTWQLTRDPMLQQGMHRMICKRAQAASIETEIGCYTFRVTGITAYLGNGARLEVAQVSESVVFR
jgi:integrase/recombinase XerD